MKDLVTLNVAALSQTSIVLADVKKDFELQNLCKLINPAGAKLSHSSSTLYSHTQASKMKRSAVPQTAG